MERQSPSDLLDEIAVQRERLRASDAQADPDGDLDALLERITHHLQATDSTGPTVGVAPRLAEVAQTLAAADDVTETLQQVVALAVDSVPGCDFAGVSILHPGQSIDSPAVTDDIVAQCDALQYELGEGPCLDAVWDENTRLIDDMSDDAQWPRFAERAAALGVGSLLAAQLDTGRGTIGALNLYSRDKQVYDEESREIALAFAAHAAVALAGAQRERHLRTAVESRQVIGQAVGVLMERHQLSAGSAFDMLVGASQKTGLKLRDIAARVVAAGPDSIR